MIVPGAEQHTLGAVVVTGQMRRLGLSVCLRLGPDRTEVIELLRSRVFDVAMLSIGHGERLELSRKLVNTLRTFGPRDMPIMAGGAAAAGRTDLAERTGVDYVTQDLGEALTFCGCAPLVSVAAPAPAMVSLRG